MEELGFTTVKLGGDSACTHLGEGGGGQKHDSASTWKIESKQIQSCSQSLEESVGDLRDAPYHRRGRAGR